MIKLGVYKYTQLLRKERTLTRICKAEKTISVTLYEAVAGLPDAEVFTERILCQLSDERGAWKRTYSNRFPEFDRFVINYLQQEAGTDRSLRVADLAVSDARTSVDFYERLVRYWPGIQFEALDYDPKVTVIEGGRTKVALSSRGRILEVVYPPFVFNALTPDSVRRYPLNRIILRLVLKFKARPLLENHIGGRVVPREIRLFAPAALSLAESDSRFNLGQHDLLKPLRDPGSSDVIRAMNVLNTTYFLPDDRARVVSNIYSGLIDGGWLVTGSNQEAGSLVHGGIYRKTPAGFEKIWQSGSGSPFEPEILGLAGREGTSPTAD